MTRFTLNRFSRDQRGFTLYEVLIVIVIFGLLAAMGIPYSLKAYRHYSLTTETKNIISVIRRAESMAMANVGEANFGVYFSTTGSTLFRGNTYATRTAAYDESYPFSSSVTITGATEIDFARISGKPGNAVTLTISNGTTSQKIIVSAEGAVDW